MFFSTLQLSKLAVLTGTVMSTQSALAAVTPSPDKNFVYDVAVIGGGASGTYAAVALKDQGKRVAVVEKNDYLGGHAETYTDPKSKIPVELGARIFPDNQIVRDFFGRFKIPLSPSAAAAPGDTTYADFRTGKIVKYSPPDAAASGAALGRYAAEVAKYPFLENPGYDLPNPIPADLLLPFSDFIKKHDLTDGLTLIALFLEGFGDFLKLPSLFVLHYLNAEFLNGIFTGTLVTTSAHNTDLLYDAALKFLDQSVYLRSTLCSVKRAGSGPNTLDINTPKGRLTIKAKKILVTFPQLPQNFRGWDLDANEKSIFGAFDFGSWHVGLLRNAGLASNLTVQNTALNTAYNLPPLPAVYNFNPSPDPALTLAYYGSNDATTDNESQKAILGALDRLRAGGAVPKANANPKPSLVALRLHGPYGVHVSAAAVKSGFYKKLYALQGKKDTFYTGAAFDRQSSAGVWAYTKKLLPSLTSDTPQAGTY